MASNKEGLKRSREKTSSVESVGSIIHTDQMRKKHKNINNLEASLVYHFFPLKYSNLTGNRKRSDTEFDSETESVCSNSQSPGEGGHITSEFKVHSKKQQQLPSSKMPDPINPEQLLQELAKGRLRVYPYTTFKGWTDDLFWVKLMQVMFPYSASRHYTAPSMRDVMEVILKLQQTYSFRNYGAMTPEAITDMEVVFGPEFDNGPFNARLVNPAFLPWSETIYEGEEGHARALNLLPPPEDDSSDDGVTWATSPRVLGGVTCKQIELPVQNEKEKKKKKMERAGESSSLDTLPCHSNSQSLVHGKHFSRSQVGIVDKNDLSFLYHQDVKDFSEADQALLLKHCRPSGSTYGNLLLSPSSKRKLILQEFLHRIKESEPPSSPSHYHVCLPKF